MVWMGLTLVYGVLKGARELVKKKAMEISSVVEILLIYTAISFLLVIPQATKAMGLELWQYGAIIVKSSAIFFAWILSFNVLKKLSVGIYGILDLSRVLFNTLLGVVILGEVLVPLQAAGLLLVCAGLLMLKWLPGMKKKYQEGTAEQDGESVDIKTVLMALLSCLLNAISGFLDKVLMKDMNSSQLQFWYMLFLLIMYIVYFFLKETVVDLRRSLKNKWIWLLAIMFVIADKALFVANGYPESKLSVMTLIKQSACVVSIIGGRLFFKEKNTAYKLMCASVVIIGMLLAAIANT